MSSHCAHRCSPLVSYLLQLLRAPFYEGETEAQGDIRLAWPVSGRVRTRSPRGPLGSLSGAGRAVSCGLGHVLATHTCRVFSSCRVDPVPHDAPKPPGYTRFVCVSDTHSRTDPVQMPYGDVLIHAGDFTELGLPSEVKKFNEWLGRCRAGGGLPALPGAPLSGLALPAHLPWEAFPDSPLSVIPRRLLPQHTPQP